jgi:tetratricopeptide (TPR) repeat protein
MSVKILSLIILLAIIVSGTMSAAGPAKPETRASVLGRAGWEAIRAGKLPEAAQAFQDAIAADPADASLFLGAGLVAHLQGQEGEARQALQDALQRDPKLSAASLLLGEIAYRAGDLDNAIRTYESALALAPDNTRIGARLDTWRKEAALHGRFQQFLNPHFTVLFEGPAEQGLAAHAIEVLEAAYWRIGTALLAYPPDVITVLLYTDEQFRDITRSPTWAGGLFDGKIRVPMRGALNEPKRLEKVLAHEFTHALVKSLAPREVPVWLNEGLAVVFEMGDMRWAEQAVGKAPALIPLSTLHGTFANLPQDQVQLAYAESALAVQALLDRDGVQALSALLRDLGEGQPFAAAFERRFFLSYAEFQAAWSLPLRTKS